MGSPIDGLTLAIAAGDPDDLVDQLAEFRGASLAVLGSDPDELQQRAEEFLAAERASRERMVEEARRQQRPAATTAAGRTALAWAWFRRVRRGAAPVTGPCRAGRPGRGRT